mgnify:CR=1 FL=1
MKFFTFLILITLSLSSFSQNLYKETVVGEIQKTFTKDYGIKEEFWSAKSKNVKKPIKNPVKKIKEKVVSNKIKTTVKVTEPTKKIKKPLVDSEDEGWTKYKKREKRGLIDNGEFVKYVPSKRKKISKSHKKNKKKVINKPSKKDWMSQKMNEQSIWNNTKKSQLTKWEKEKAAMLNRWQNEKKKYFKNIPTYKKNLTPQSVFSSAGSFPPNREKLTAKFKGDGVVLVPNAFYKEVKDQGKRPTCSAFASTRALEISLAQSGTVKRLSDQYIYYASKPYCQSSPCSKKGSWPLAAFKQSIRSSQADIPSQKACPYSKYPKSGNETQIPLKNGCFSGEHKLKKFKQVKSLKQIIAALDKGYPVVSGFKLTPNFYRNKGVVLSKDISKSKRMDSHAAGHAILFVGYMKIPTSLEEGKVCFITANSWGTGWGKGGHACLSEKWVTKYRFNIPFLAVQKVI